MTEEDLNSIDTHERLVDAKIKTWSPEQRVALAAAMAERWLPVYEAFSIREAWGNPDHMRRSLEAVWNHLRGRPLSSSDVSRYVAQVEDSTPHMDIFDDEAAMSACVMVSEALLCCKTDQNAAPTMQAVISGFYAVDPNWDMDLEEQPRLWQQIQVRREIKKQRKLIEEIDAITHFDDETIQALRKKLVLKEYIGEDTPADRTSESPAPITNQTAFEVYRRLVESDLKNNKRDWWQEPGNEPGSYPRAIRLFAEWAGRYRRRGDTINPGFGSSQLADQTVQQAIIAQRRAKDSAETDLPDWGPELQQLIDLALQNAPSNEFDVTAFDQPHGYGPSMRALWSEGKGLGQPETEAWWHIVAWARHRPTAWDVEDRRKKQGLAYTSPELGVLLARETNWDSADDLDHPWETEVVGERWHIRLNDFPDDLMYSLVINGECVGDFHDWPETWQREDVK
jgi:uncharacterized protein YjaG (DUF416 family)